MDCKQQQEIRPQYFFFCQTNAKTQSKHSNFVNEFLCLSFCSYSIIFDTNLTVTQATPFRLSDQINQAGKQHRDNSNRIKQFCLGTCVHHKCARDQIDYFSLLLNFNEFTRRNTDAEIDMLCAFHHFRFNFERWHFREMCRIILSFSVYLRVLRPVESVYCFIFCVCQWIYQSFTAFAWKL